MSSKSKSIAPPSGKKTGDRYAKADLPTVSIFGEDLEPLESLGEQLASLLKQRKEISAQIEDLYRLSKETIEEVNSDASWSVRDDAERWTWVYVKPGPSKKLVKESLIRGMAGAGISKAKIEKIMADAIKETPKKPYLTLFIAGEASAPRNDEDE